MGACLFLTRLDGVLVGFASWDPRQRPRLGIVGHNCILPEFRGRGYGRTQIEEVLRRFKGMGIQTACVTTCDHPFFAPAHRMYQACGFHEVRRIPWDRDPSLMVIECEKANCPVALGYGRTSLIYGSLTDFSSLVNLGRVEAVRRDSMVAVGQDQPR